MMRRRHATGIVAAVLLALAACNTEAGSTPSATQAVGETVGSLELTDADAPTPPLTSPGENTVPAGSPDITGLGNCNVEVTGTVTDQWSTEATDESVTFGGWLSDITLAEAAANSIAIDPSYLVLTCRSSGNRSISFTGNGDVRQRPANFRLTLDPSGTTPSARNAVNVVLALEADGVCVLGGDGALTIATFDATRIDGSFDVPFVCADGGTVRATGSFNFARPEVETPPAATTTP